MSRGKLPADRYAPLQAEIPSSPAVEKKLPDLRIGDSKFDLDGIFPIEHTIFNVFLHPAKSTDSIEHVEKKFKLDDDQLPPKIYHLNKGLLQKGHLPIIYVRNCSSSENLGGSYVWEGPDAPIQRKRFEVVLRQHSLAGKDQDQNFLVLGLREEEYLVLSDLFAQIALGVSRAEIVEILKNANTTENVPSRMIFNLNRRIAQLGLAITSTGGKNTSYRLGKIDEG